MKEVIDLSGLGHAKSPQIKQLRLKEIKDGKGYYDVYTRWPGCPDLDDYLRVLYQTNPTKVTAIDFDGGPYLIKGSIVDGYTITDFLSDENANNVVVCLENVVHN